MTIQDCRQYKENILEDLKKIEQLTKTIKENRKKLAVGLYDIDDYDTIRPKYKHMYVYINSIGSNGVGCIVIDDDMNDEEWCQPEEIEL